MINPSYVVSLTYHKLDDTNYEILEKNYIDFRGAVLHDGIPEDISIYSNEWIGSIQGELQYDTAYYSVFNVKTEYHKDYWGEVDQDIDWEVVCHHKVGNVESYLTGVYDGADNEPATIEFKLL